MYAAGVDLVSDDDLEERLAAVRREVGDPRVGLYGPESLAWRVNRESALLVGGGCAALLQLAHPAVAYAVDEHSATRSDPQGRFRRTFANVYAMVFGDLDHALAAARRVHAVHARVTGRLGERAGPFAAGDRYAANDVEALFWVHATLVHTAVQVYDRVVAPLSAREREGYYRETRRFAALFGIPDAAMPQGWEAFEAYVERAVRGTLGVTRPAAEIARFLLAPATPLHAPLARAYRLVTALLLPESLRAPYGLGLGRRERAEAALHLGAFAAAYRALPRALRDVPAYSAARRRLAYGPRARPTARERAGRVLHRGVLRMMRV
jgi:uncharacterized protein (DUF2236 family)